MDTHHRLARLLAAVLCQLLLCVFLPLVLAESPKSLRIMPMGDSITHGTIPGGYRHPLYDLLTKNGHTFDFVGAKNQRGDTCPDPDHWGQGGWQITQTPATVDGRSYVSIQGENRSGLYEEMSQAISTDYFSIDTASTTNIILLQIGINDVLHQVVDSEHGSFNSDVGKDGWGEGQEWIAQGCIQRLQALLRLIDRTAATNQLQIEVIIGTLCPLTKNWRGDPVSDVLIDQVVQYNHLIGEVIPSLTFTNLRVTIVDHHTASAGKLSDGLHPNREGYEAMARVWYEGITAAGD
jgi:lysophospholipase L1-like esterase